MRSEENAKSHAAVAPSTFSRCRRISGRLTDFIGKIVAPKAWSHQQINGPDRILIWLIRFAIGQLFHDCHGLAKHRVKSLARDKKGPPTLTCITWNELQSERISLSDSSDNSITRELHHLYINLSINQSINLSIYLFNYLSIHTYIHTSIHAYLHTYIPTYLHTYIPTYLHTYIPTYLHTHIPTYPHTHIPTYPHTHIPTYPHTYIPTYLHTYIPTYLHT